MTLLYSVVSYGFIRSAFRDSLSPYVDFAYMI